MSDRSQRIKLFLPFVLVLFFITTGALFILMMEDAPVWAASRADSIHADAVIEKADALDSKYAREHWKYGWKGSKYGYSSKLVDCAGFCRNVYAALGAPTGHWYTRHGRVVHCDRLTSAGFRYWNIGGDDGMKISDAAKGGHIRKGDIVGYRQIQTPHDLRAIWQCCRNCHGRCSGNLSQYLMTQLRGSCLKTGIINPAICGSKLLQAAVRGAAQ